MTCSCYISTRSVPRLASRRHGTIPTSIYAVHAILPCRAVCCVHACIAGTVSASSFGLWTGRRADRPGHSACWRLARLGHGTCMPLLGRHDNDISVWVPPYRATGRPA